MRWREQRQWLIHERSHVLYFLKEHGWKRGEGRLRWRTHSQNHGAWKNKKILHPMQWDLITRLITSSYCDCYSWQSQYSSFPSRGGGKGDDSGMRRLKQEIEQSGESNQMTSSQQMVRRGKQGSWGGGLWPWNNKVWKQARVDELCRLTKFLLHAIFSRDDSNPFYTWTLLLPLQNPQEVGRCTCVSAISNLVTRLVSIPIVPWDHCSSEEEQGRDISLLWESSYIAVKQDTPHIEKDVDQFYPQSSYVRGLQTVGLMIWSLFSPTCPTHSFDFPQETYTCFLKQLLFAVKVTFWGKLNCCIISTIIHNNSSNNLAVSASKWQTI